MKNQTELEKAIVEATKYFAEVNEVHFDSMTESMVINAIRETAQFYKEKYEGVEVTVQKEFIESYINLFPKGVRTGGKLVRSDKKGTEKKMKSFLKDYKYSQEDILKATELYVSKFKTKGDYTGMCSAVYLINKQDRGSVLAEECENYLENKESKTVQQAMIYGSKRG